MYNTVCITKQTLAIIITIDLRTGQKSVLLFHWIGLESLLDALDNSSFYFQCAPVDGSVAGNQDTSGSNFIRGDVTLDQRGGRLVLEVFVHHLLKWDTLLVCQRLHVLLHAFCPRGAGEDAVDGNAGSLGQLGKTSGYGDLGSLGHGVVDHKLDRTQSCLAADDDNLIE